MEEGSKVELRPKDAGQSSGIGLQHFQEEFVHHDTTVFLQVEPELLGQQLDVCDGGQQEEELAQAAGLTPVTRLDTVDQRVLQLVLETPNRLAGLQSHICNNNRHWNQLPLSLSNGIHYVTKLPLFLSNDYNTLQSCLSFFLMTDNTLQSCPSLSFFLSKDIQHITKLPFFLSNDIQYVTKLPLCLSF